MRGAALASYLLFEASYTCDLIRLGRNDALARRDDVVAFFGTGGGGNLELPEAADAA